MTESHTPKPASRKRNWSATNEPFNNDQAARIETKRRLLSIIAEVETRAFDSNDLKIMYNTVVKTGDDNYSLLAQNLNELVNRVGILARDSDVGRKEFEDAAWWLKFRLSHALETSPDSLDEVSRKLKMFPEKAPDYLQLPDYPMPPSPSWSKFPHSSTMPDPGAEAVASWMEPFLCPINELPPLNFQRERMRWKMRESRLPVLSDYALLWPLYVEKYWTQLGPKVLDLLDPHRPYRLSHWFMEKLFRSSWYLSKYRDNSKEDVAAKLIHSIAHGTMGSLEVAATLGLWPSSLPFLLEERQKTLPESEYRSELVRALMCAFMGFDMIGNSPRAVSKPTTENAWAPPTCLLPAGYLNEADFVKTARLQTITYLCEQVGPLADIHLSRNSDETCSFVSFAFLAAITFHDLSILERVLDQGASLDPAVIQAIRYARRQLHLGNMDLVAQAYLAILDHAMVTFLKGPQVKWLRETVQAVDAAFGGEVLLANKGNKQPIRNATLDQVINLATDAIMDENIIHLRRVLLDPRFAPSQLGLGADGSNPRYLHLAVENDCLDAIKDLIDSGAPLTEVDERGRTPLLCVESIKTLALLVKLGANTKDVDVDGRNIWHLAAASNDVRLLDWLCHNDPNKKENISTLNGFGRTPLADALYMVHDVIGDVVMEGARLNPATARRLLLEDLDESCLRSSIPLSGMAVMWGAVDVIDSLKALGVDFSSTDTCGRTPLQYINLWTPPSTIEHLCKLTHGIPSSAATRGAPGIAIFQNTLDILASLGPESMVIMEERYCDELEPRVYNLLLKEEWLNHTDKNGCSWRNICRMASSFITEESYIRCYDWLESAFETAIHCHIEHGAHTAYEKAKRTPALRPMLPYEDFDLGEDDAAAFEPNVFLVVLDHSDTELLSDCSEWAVFYKMLCFFVSTGDIDHAKLLVETLKVPLEAPSGVFTIDCGFPEPWDDDEEKTNTILNELPNLYTEDPEMYALLVKAATPEQLSQLGQDLFYTIFEHNDPEESVSTLDTLLQEGMDVNMHGATPLRIAVTYEENEAVVFLLSRNADPFVTTQYGELCAFVLCARMGNTQIFKSLVAGLPGDFPWDRIWDSGTEWNDAQNIIQILASQPRRSARLLRILFEGTKGYEVAINAAPGKKKLSAAQLAAEAGRAQALRVLWQHGADLRARYDGPEGLTIAHKAVREGRKNIVSLLRKIDPGALRVPDANGVLPLPESSGVEEEGEGEDEEDWEDEDDEDDEDDEEEEEDDDDDDKGGEEEEKKDDGNCQE